MLSIAQMWSGVFLSEMECMAHVVVFTAPCCLPVPHVYCSNFYTWYTCAGEEKSVGRGRHEAVSAAASQPSAFNTPQQPQSLSCAVRYESQFALLG